MIFIFFNLFGKKKSQKSENSEESVATLRYLSNNLCNLLEDEDTEILNDDIVYLPNYDLKIRLEANKLTEHSAVLNFFLNCPKWDQQIFECCASPGSNTEKAIELALKNFVHGLLSGICTMYNGEPKCRLETTFNGKKHRWTVYDGDFIAMGKNLKNPPDVQNYWSFIKPQLSDYLGDRKLCFIKVFGSSVNNEIIGECRINDLKITKLSDQVAEMIAKSNVPDYTFYKQFFFFVQDDETCHSYPYTQEQITEKLRIALSVFEKLLLEEDGYELCRNELVKQLGDKHLAAEIFSFLPEFCAQWQFPKLQPSETLLISFDNEMHEYSISQISAYYMILYSVKELIYAKEFSNDLFFNLISISAAWDVICSAKKDGFDITESGGPIQTAYYFPDGYIAR